MQPLGNGSGIGFIHYDPEYKVLLCPGRSEPVMGIYGFDKSSEQMLTHQAYLNWGSNTTTAFTFGPKHVVDTSK